jgi:hypothetical protein
MKKIMIIIIIIFTLTRVNMIYNLSFDKWLRLCLGLTLKLNFKTMIIIIFILVYFN